MRIALAVLALLAIAAGWAFAEPYTLTVTRDTVTSPDIPAEFDGVRIAYLTDVHAGPFFSAERVGRLIDTVNNQRPHLVILGGDNVGGKSGGAALFYPQASRLSAPLGVIAVMGNHDVWEGHAQARSQLASAGAVVLENANARVRLGGGWIRVGGVVDLDTGAPDIAEAAADIGTGEFAILVSHNPDVFAELPEVRGAFDLALGAHTHGGQVTYFGLGAPLVPSKFGERYRQGWRTEGGVPILVSRGVGTMNLPIRFFAPPQIHVIELRQGETAGVTRTPEG